MKTELKCKGCKKDIPKVEYDEKTHSATWFGIYTGTKLIQWICVECWKKGVRYDKVEK